MLVAQGTLSHVCELDRSFGARVHEPVAAHRVELSRRDHLGQLFHVRRLDVDNVKALVLDVQIPQIDAQIIAADEGLPVTVHRDAVDVVGVGVGIRPPRHSGNHGIVVRQPRELQVAGIAELYVWHRARRPSSAGYVRGSQVVGEIVLGHDLE